MTSRSTDLARLPAMPKILDDPSKATAPGGLAAWWRVARRASYQRRIQQLWAVDAAADMSTLSDSKIWVTVISWTIVDSCVYTLVGLSKHVVE